MLNDNDKSNNCKRKVNIKLSIENVKAVLNRVSELMLDHAYSVGANISSFSASVIRMYDGSLESGDYKFIKSYGMERFIDKNTLILIDLYL